MTKASHDDRDGDSKNNNDCVETHDARYLAQGAAREGISNLQDRGIWIARGRMFEMRRQRLNGHKYFHATRNDLIRHSALAVLLAFGGIVGEANAFRLLDYGRWVDCLAAPGASQDCAAVDPGEVPNIEACGRANATVTYWIDENSIPANLSLAEVRSAVNIAARAWEGVSGLRTPLRFVEATTAPASLVDATDDVVVISWDRAFRYVDLGKWAVTLMGCSDGALSPGPDVVLNGSGRVYSWDDTPLFIATPNWVTTARRIPGVGDQYLPGVLTHEFGHVLGLMHSLSQKATMYVEGNTRDWFQQVRGVSLTTDDKHALKYLYGPNSAPRIQSFVSPMTVAPGGLGILVLSAEDPERDDLRYRWSQSREASREGGKMKSEAGCNRRSDTCGWQAPSTAGRYTVTGWVRDVRHASYDVKRDVDVIVGVPEETLSVTLDSDPAAGYSPLTVNLVATASGTAEGAISYWLYCNRDDADTVVLPGWGPPVAPTSENPRRLAGACTYNSPGMYTAKIIAKRGRAPWVEDRVKIAVAGCGDASVESGEECDGTDDLACPGLCQADCTCGATPATPTPTVTTCNGPSVVYTNDFAGAVGSEWSSTVTELTPLGAQRFLGQFSHSEGVNLNLVGMPAHSSVVVSFDLLMINSWDGNIDPDEWMVGVAGGQTLLRTTFSNIDSYPNIGTRRQAYPDAYPGGDNPPRSGAVAVNTLGYGLCGGFSCGDATYHVTLAFSHEDSAISLNFQAVGGGLNDESWGLDNVTVNVDCGGGLPIPTPTQTSGVSTDVFFEDNFDGIALDSTKWSLGASCADAVAVDGGFVAVGQPGEEWCLFPTASSVGTVFPPTGDFRIEVALEYTTVLGGGDGLAVDGSTWTWGPWGDTSGGVRVNLGGRYDSVSIQPPDGWHRYALEVSEDTWTSFVDDTPTLTQSGLPRPTSVWFGNPFAGPAIGAASTFRIDYIRVTL